MKSVIKNIIVFFLVLFLIVCSLSLYIGNYLYDYTLNPKAVNYIGKNIEIDEHIYQDAKNWLNQNGQNVSIVSYDGLKLHGTLVDNQSDVYVIMVHGYRGDGASIISPIKKMNNKGYNLLIPDLRGHGESEGDYIGMGWDDRHDILQWVNFLLDINPNISIVLYGVSMGGATVMNVAGEDTPHQVKAVIEDCGYTSVWDLFKAHIDMNNLESEIALRMASFATRLRAGYAIEDDQPIEQVKKSKVPILFIHGDQDDFVPFSMLDDLYNAANCEKQKLIIQGASHANSCSVNTKLYYQTIFDFIENSVRSIN